MRRWRFLRRKTTACRCGATFLVLLFFIYCLPLPALANPKGGQVTAGQATFTHEPGRLTVTQSSDRAVIQWKGFSIDVGELTRFIQPSSQSAVLNRVMSALPSSIHGSLLANGKVFLINPNGVIVGPTGRIKTGSFVASTLDVPDSQFMAGGDLLFSGDSDAGIENLGTIEATDGDILLIAHQVENAGTLKAPDGIVGLAAGSEVLLKKAGDERIFVKSALSYEEAEEGVGNTGLIEAAQAELKAAGGNIYALAVNNGGAIHATGMINEGGRIFLKSIGGEIKNSGTITARKVDGDGGTIQLQSEGDYPSTVTNSGTLDASGTTPGTKGGSVTMTGDRVALTEEALVDVSGDTGGGEVLIGGGFQGNNPDVYNAKETFVGQDVSIEADAITEGDGGRVIVWSDEATRFYGTISARGGELSGDGGFAEVSGGYLDYRGTTDLRAPHGEFGALLLDPESITISDQPDSNVTSESPFEPAAAGVANLNNTTLEAALATAEVTVRTADHGTPDWDDPGNLTVDDAITWAAATTLTLDATNDLLISASITNPNGTLRLNHGRNLSSDAAATVHVDTLEISPGGLGFAAIALSGPVVAQHVNFRQLKYYLTGISMNNPSNQLGALNFPDPPIDVIDGNVEIYDSADGLSVSGDVYDTPYLNTHLQIRTVGDLILNTGMAMRWASDVYLEARNGRFINNAGGDAFGDLTGKLRIYSEHPDNDTLAGLPSSYGEWGRFYNATWESSPPSAWDSDPRNLSLYSIAPVLTFTAEDKTKVYGSPNPSLTWSLSGLIGGDTEADAYSGAPELTTAATETTGAGTYAIDGSQGSLSMNQGYQYQLIDGTLEVTKAPLAIAADDQNKLAGTPNPPLTATYTGLVAGDTEEVVTGLTLTTTAVETSPPGDYLITAANAQADNYDITLADGTLQILLNAAALTITADDVSRLYGGENNLTLTWEGLQPGDDPSVVDLDINTPATVTSPVGTYPISLSLVWAPDYYDVVLADGTLTVNPAPLTASAEDKTKRIGDPVPPLTATYTGLVAGDTEEVVTGLTLTTTADQQSPPGAYAITAGNGQADNYDITLVNGQLTVKDPYPLTIKADDKSRLYGRENPELTVAYTGLQDGDDASCVTGLEVTTAASHSDVGTYPVTPSGGSLPPYYDVTYASGTLTVEPAPLTIRANDVTTVYGDPIGPLTATLEGLVAGDEGVISPYLVAFGTRWFADAYRTSEVTSHTADTIPGKYPIYAYRVSTPNYTTTYKQGTLTVMPRPLTIRAFDAYMVEGQPYPEFRWIGLQNIPVWDSSGNMRVDCKVSDCYGNTCWVTATTTEGTTRRQFIVPEVTWKYEEYRTYDVKVEPGTLTTFNPNERIPPVPPPPPQFGVVGLRDIVPPFRVPPEGQGFIRYAAEQFIKDMKLDVTDIDEWLKEPANRGLMVGKLIELLKATLEPGTDLYKQREIVKTYLEDQLREMKVQIAKDAVQKYNDWKKQQEEEKHYIQYKVLGLLGGTLETPDEDFVFTATGQYISGAISAASIAALVTTYAAMATTLSVTSYGILGGDIAAGGTSAEILIKAGLSVSTAGTAGGVIAGVLFAVATAVTRSLQLSDYMEVEDKYANLVNDARNFDIDSLLTGDDAALSDLAGLLMTAALKEPTVQEGFFWLSR